MFVVGKFSEAGELDVLLLAVLPTVGHNFVGVGADVIAFETVKVGGFIVRPEVLIVRAVLVTTVHVRSELLEIVAHQLIETFVSSCVLDEARLVTEAVKAVFATAMKVGLMVAVTAVGEVAVLIEAELQISAGNGIVFVRLFLILLRPLRGFLFLLNVKLIELI